MRISITDARFESTDLLWKMYAQTDFTGCTFVGKAQNCNFAESTFIDCMFEPTFVFENCNIIGTTGLPERLAPPARIEPPQPGQRPGSR